MSMGMRENDLSNAEIRILKKKFAQYSKADTSHGATFDTMELHNTTMNQTEWAYFAKDCGIVPQLADINTLRQVFARAQRKDSDRGRFTFEEFVVGNYLLASHAFGEDAQAVHRLMGCLDSTLGHSLTTAAPGSALDVLWREWFGTAPPAKDEAGLTPLQLKQLANKMAAAGMVVSSAPKMAVATQRKIVRHALLSFRPERASRSPPLHGLQPRSSPPLGVSHHSAAMGSPPEMSLGPSAHRSPPLMPLGPSAHRSVSPGAAPGAAAPGGASRHFAVADHGAGTVSSFEAIDRNGDGMIDRDEWDEAMQGSMQSWEQKMEREYDLTQTPEGELEELQKAAVEAEAVHGRHDLEAQKELFKRAQRRAWGLDSAADLLQEPVAEHSSVTEASSLEAPPPTKADRMKAGDQREAQARQKLQQQQKQVLASRIPSPGHPPSDTPSSIPSPRSHRSSVPPRRAAGSRGRDTAGRGRGQRGRKDILTETVHMAEAPAEDRAVIDEAGPATGPAAGSQRIHRDMQVHELQEYYEELQSLIVTLQRKNASLQQQQQRQESQIIQAEAARKAAEEQRDVALDSADSLRAEVQRLMQQGYDEAAVVRSLKMQVLRADQAMEEIRDAQFEHTRNMKAAHQEILDEQLGEMRRQLWHTQAQLREARGPIGVDVSAMRIESLEGELQRLRVQLHPPETVDQQQNHR